MTRLPMPSLFLSHGAPTLLIEDIPARHFLAELGQKIGKPSAILVASAHWLAPGPLVSTATKPETIHDFYGFPAELYQITYPAAGSPALAQRTAELLHDAGLSAGLDPNRGFDHGVWSPLALMYPDADVPVVSLSLPPDGGPAENLRIGEALRPLRDENVLVIGSGALTHSLRDYFGHEQDDPMIDWVRGFQDWTLDAVTRDDRASLLDYRRLAPSASRNHPTDEHLMPLFVALGAGAPGIPGRRLHSSATHAVIAMDAYAWD